MRALRDFLLAPPDMGARAATASLALDTADRVTAPASLAVLCASVDARAIAVAAATLLARRHRAPCGVACVWTAPGLERNAGDPRPPAGRGARRLAAALDARGLDARACGRAVEVTLPEDPSHAVAAATRADAAAGPAPAVLVLGGPRDAAFDAVLAGSDRILVLGRAGGDDAVAALAVAGLGAPAGRATAHGIALGPAARWLAAGGLVVPAALRRALADALEDAA